ncbi:hypothetical protein [Amycolatopsis vastitatis]|uniref:Uncharacterized protein n=1 Tax=Amycolatopsis vastitatis TaxID=1905142 RepID=A0A229T249_9PSEU|nr:hypothetical protein [Amycolatopsis vastitatis]OXM65308.1 hypothetical protein CF165_23550 [Amycolatopsis vastitatis]
MTDTKTEREQVAEIYAEQDETVQEIIKEVLSTERSRLHLRSQDKATVDLLVNAIRRIVK